MACLLQCIGFLLVAYGDSWLAICGVVSTSLSAGLGEATYLAYSAKFHKYVLKNKE